MFFFFFYYRSLGTISVKVEILWQYWLSFIINRVSPLVSCRDIFIRLQLSVQFPFLISFPICREILGTCFQFSSKVSIICWQDVIESGIALLFMYNKFGLWFQQKKNAGPGTQLISTKKKKNPKHHMSVWSVQHQLHSFSFSNLSDQTVQCGRWVEPDSRVAQSATASSIMDPSLSSCARPLPHQHKPPLPP